VDERRAEIAVPAEIRCVAIARNFAVEMARTAGWPESAQLEDLRLLVSEAVTNAVRAQQQRGGEELVHVHCAVGADRVEVRVVDRAGGFEFPEQPGVVPVADVTRAGGFGLPLIGALADEARFGPADDGTEVVLVIRRGVGAAG